MKKVFICLVSAGVLVFAACSKKANPTKTEENKPAVVATTYSNAIQPLVQAKCAPCHIPSKGGRKADLDSYASASKLGADMLKRIEMNPTDRGFMPMRSPKLSAEEIAIVRKWVEGGMAEK